ncbi:MAG: demethylmenaquinone methyltransferase/2-methoxy-6-polyprenyl-1,4-benzoquinol methylase [Candidatus Krumholzibacteriia bacterium]|jgi:demethylmenaquinone methyltransferase/2-methoxy-6-polyprenyl-1,4-benzoquinol methylase
MNVAEAPDFKDLHGRQTGSWAVKDGEAHGKEVRSMFARISGIYDFMNHLLSFNRDKAWRKNVAALLDYDTWEILDLCAGTGDLALTCVKEGKGRTWIAADFCPEMLLGAHGKKNAEQLDLSAADAMNLPFKSRSVDAVTVGFGVRNFADVRRGLEEIKRVLRPGGQLMVLEFYRDNPEGQGEGRGVPSLIRFGLNNIIPLLGKVVGRDSAAYSYLPNSMGEFLTPDEFAALLKEFEFDDVIVERQTFGIAHIVGGRTP